MKAESSWVKGHNQVPGALRIIDHTDYEEIDLELMQLGEIPS